MEPLKTQGETAVFHRKPLKIDRKTMGFKSICNNGMGTTPAIKILVRRASATPSNHLQLTSVYSKGGSEWQNNSFKLAYRKLESGIVMKRRHRADSPGKVQLETSWKIGLNGIIQQVCVENESIAGGYDRLNRYRALITESREERREKVTTWSRCSGTCP